MIKFLDLKKINNSFRAEMDNRIREILDAWRVIGIMATNACSLIERKPDWDELFGKYISSDVRDEYDLRCQARFLLENEDFRKRCVSECQNAIEKMNAGKNDSKICGIFWK